MKENLKFFCIIIFLFLQIIFIYSFLNQDLKNIKEIGKIQYSSSIGIDSSTITTYYIFEKNNELYYRKGLKQITINGQTEEKIQEIKSIKNIDELKKEIEKKQKTDQQFKCEKVSVKCFIKTKELNEKEFWNTIMKK